MKLEAGRFEKIKIRREDAIRKLSSEDRGDKGLIRKVVFEDGIQKDKNISEEQKDKIIEIN